MKKNARWPYPSPEPVRVPTSTRRVWFGWYSEVLFGVNPFARTTEAASLARSPVASCCVKAGSGALRVLAGEDAVPPVVGVVAGGVVGVLAVGWLAAGWVAGGGGAPGARCGCG